MKCFDIRRQLRYRLLFDSILTLLPPRFNKGCTTTVSIISRWKIGISLSLNNGSLMFWQLGLQSSQKTLSFFVPYCKTFLFMVGTMPLMRSSSSARTCTGKSFVTPLVINKSIDPFLCHRHKHSNTFFSNLSKDGCSGILGVFLHKHRLYQWHIFS